MKYNNTFFVPNNKNKPLENACVFITFLWIIGTKSGRKGRNFLLKHFTAFPRRMTVYCPLIYYLAKSVYSLEHSQLYYAWKIFFLNSSTSSQPSLLKQGHGTWSVYQTSSFGLFQQPFSIITYLLAAPFQQFSEKTKRRNAVFVF